MLKPYNSLGVIYLLLKDYKVALGHFEKAIKQRPVFFDAHCNLGGTWYMLGDNEEAIKHFDRAIELKSELTKADIVRRDAQDVLAIAYKTRGEAKKALKQEDDANLDFAKAYNQWAREAFENKQYQEAVKNYDSILRLYPEIAIFYDYRGNAKSKLGKYKADLGDLEDALKLYQAAIDDHNKAIKLQSEEAQYYRHRGGIRFWRAVIRDHNGMIEDYESAIEDFTKAIKRKSEFMRKSDFTDIYKLRGEVRCLLGYVKANQGNSKEAREHYKLGLEDFKKAIEEAPNNPSSHRGLGLANAALGKSKAAIAAFEKVKELEGKTGK